MTHSIIILTILSLIPLYITSFKLKEKSLALLSFISITTHPIMDMFQTYTPIIYSISNFSIQVSVKGNILISQSITPYIQFQITSKQTSKTFH
jgi:membrane-bound metal-dependent hydrolase YbcI (DUF457 family)